MLDSPLFVMGFLFGFVVAGVIAFLYSLIREWRKKINAYRNPQIVIQRTAKSPRAVARDAAVANTKRTLTWGVIFLLLLLVLGELFLDNFIVNVIRSALGLFN